MTIDRPILVECITPLHFCNHDQVVDDDFIVTFEQVTPVSATVPNMENIYFYFYNKHALCRQTPGLSRYVPREDTWLKWTPALSGYLL